MNLLLDPVTSCQDPLEKRLVTFSFLISKE